MLPLELRLLSRSLLAQPLHRSFSSSPRSFRPAHSLESPTYPGLFYHSLPSPARNAYSLSFLDTPPPSLAFSPTTIGLLRPPPEDQGTEGPPELVPRNFKENPDFRELLHEVLRGAVAGDEWMQTMAKIRKEGYIHISDERNPADPNRVPDPSDIIASLLIQNSEVVPSSYDKSGTHRLVTMDGMMKLNASLMKVLKEGLEKAREVEVAIHSGGLEL